MADDSLIDFRLQPRKKAIFSLVAGALLISFSGVWVTLAHVAPVVSAFYRLLFGGLILLGITFYKREMRWRGFLALIYGLAGGVLFALDLFLWHTSIHYVGPGLATILANFEVFLITACGVVFLKEKLRWPFLLAIPLALLGLFLIVGLHWQQLTSLYQRGIYLGLMAAVCYAAFLLFMRSLQAGRHALPENFILMLVSFTAAFFLGALIHSSGASFAIPDLQTGIVLVFLGLFSQSLAWMLITNALPRVPASFTGLILLLQPALSFVWDVLFFQRQTGLVNWCGVAIALVAIYMGMSSGSGAKK